VEKNQINIAIIGAGPAGASTAIFLAKKGISCTLIDKAVFPREKLCGDSFDGRVYLNLKKINPEIIAKIESGLGKYLTESSITNSRGKKLHLEFDSRFSPRILMKRLSLDNLLIEEVKKHPSIHYLDNTTISTVQQNKDTWGLSLELIQSSYPKPKTSKLKGNTNTCFCVGITLSPKNQHIMRMR
jgi:menaquinone-9 beta-reductase